MAESLTENETALLREIAHSYKLPGYPDSMRERGSKLLERLAAHFDAERTQGVPGKGATGYDTSQLSNLGNQAHGYGVTEGHRG
jgi:hypothetical protein